MCATSIKKKYDYKITIKAGDDKNKDMKRKI